ncbi:MAG: cytochrome c3 family protein [Parvibaculaceae bacterium]|nr:cytochrome c3 family protein [Parvibaculaceae bacterium]
MFSLAKKNSVFSAFASSNEALAQPAGENLGTALVLLVCSFLFLQPIWAQPAAAKSDFVSTATCQECHQEEVDAWTGSHHDWALKLPTTDTVKGDFSDITFTHFGEVTRFFRDGDAFMVTTTGPKGTPQTFPVKYVVGIEPLQQYVLETAPGRLQTLSIAWDRAGEEWYHLYPDQIITPDDGLHWTGVYQNWNSRCADCHSTGFEKNYDTATDSYQSTWSEMNVACESCHGAGSGHVAWAKSYETEIQNPTPDPYAGTPASLTPASPHAVSGMCAACHSRREPLSASSRDPHSDFHNDFNLATLRDGLYFSDGQILDEVYVYGSFVQSKMHAKGVTCTNCHEPHSLTLVAEGNALCATCHNPNGNPDFTSLPRKTYDDASHHFHEPGTAGAQCVSCHMPERTFMGVDPRRDHSFRVPRPDLSDTTGAPNACIGCHDDKSNAWAAAEIANRFPNGQWGKSHFSEAFAGARVGDGRVIPALIEMSRDATLAPIIRASALDLLVQLDAPRAAVLARASLSDVSPLVRKAAILSQAAASDAEKATLLEPLLGDPSQSVRLAAGRLLAGAPSMHIQAGSRDRLRAVWKALLDSYLATADYPEGHMKLAGFGYAVNNVRGVERAFKQAISFDPKLGSAWMSLGRLYLLTGQAERAIDIWMQGLDAAGDDAGIYLQLARLRRDRGELSAALMAMEKALVLLPDDAMVRTEAAQLYAQAGQPAQAATLIADALQRAPHNPQVQAAAIQYAFSIQDIDAARRQFEIFSTEFPEHSLRAQMLTNWPILKP